MKNFIIALLGFVVSGPSLADWEAKIHIDGNPRGGVTVGQGKLKMKGKKMRLDLTAPAAFSMIGDSASRKAWVLIPAAKMYMETTISESDLNNIPFCETDVDECLTKAGYKKTGRDKVNGYSCDVYEGDLKPPRVRALTHVKLWRVDKMKEMPLTRIQSKEEGKDKPITIDLTEIKFGPIADSVFAFPKDYNAMPNVKDLFKAPQ